MGYWIPVGNGVRVYESTLKDAYLTGAKTLLGQYRATNGQIHKAIPEYTSMSLPIYSSSTGTKYTHWVRFSNGSNPRDGYEECSYGKTYGVAFKVRTFPKNW